MSFTRSDSLGAVSRDFTITERSGRFTRCANSIANQTGNQGQSGRGSERSAATKQRATQRVTPGRGQRPKSASGKRPSSARGSVGGLGSAEASHKESPESRATNRSARPASAGRTRSAAVTGRTSNAVAAGRKSSAAAAGRKSSAAAAKPREVPRPPLYWGTVSTIGEAKPAPVGHLNPRCQAGAAHTHSAQGCSATYTFTRTDCSATYTFTRTDCSATYTFTRTDCSATYTHTVRKGAAPEREREQLASDYTGGCSTLGKDFWLGRASTSDWRRCGQVLE